MTTQIVNGEGQWPKQWAADVLVGDQFAGRLVSTMTGGVQTLRLRDTRRGHQLAAVAERPKGLPWGLDEADTWVAENERRIA